MKKNVLYSFYQHRIRFKWIHRGLKQGSFSQKSTCRRIMIKKKLDTEWKKRLPNNGNLLETTRKCDICSFLVVSISGKPYVVFTRFPHMETVNPMIPPRFPASETWEHLTSGFHEFPHLVNPVIPPRFFAL